MDPGAGSLDIGDLAFNCDWAVAPPEQVQVQAGDTTRITLQANCHRFLLDAIVFISDGGNGIGLVRPDGSRETEIAPANGLVLSIRPSPDGETLAAIYWAPDDQSNWTEASGIYLINAVTGEKTQLTRGVFVDGVSWSPDGQQLVFSMQNPAGPSGTPTGFSASIWVMNRDGSGLRRLTSGGGDHPSWSPDGQRILYQNGGTFVIRADGTENSFFNVNCFNAEWSPDGQQVACVETDPDGGSFPNLYVTNADGSGERLVVRTPPLVSNPSWSPDGTELLYTVSPSDAPSALYRIRTDGTGATRVTAGGYAYWSRGR